MVGLIGAHSGGMPSSPTPAEAAAAVVYPDGWVTPPVLLLTFREAFIRGFEADDHTTAEQAIPGNEHTQAAVLAAFHDAFDRGRAARKDTP